LRSSFFSIYIPLRTDINSDINAKVSNYKLAQDLGIYFLRLRVVNRMDVAEACKQIHEILDVLLRWYKPSNSLPTNGIYFFYEEGELSAHNGKQRIVRVGTHGQSRTLKQRLGNDHYNGNREGSVFRKHLGTALLKRTGAPDTRISEWRKKRKKSPHWKEFEGTEREVDETLRSRFFFRVIDIDNVDERQMFEEKIIATISACPVCRPSEKWLGNFAWSEKVRRSGIWNSNFVYSHARLTEKDLMRLKQLAYETL